jgi:hypothetical protein
VKRGDTVPFAERWTAPCVHVASLKDLAGNAQSVTGKGSLYVR